MAGESVMKELHGLLRKAEKLYDRQIEFVLDDEEEGLDQEEEEDEAGGFVNIVFFVTPNDGLYKDARIKFKMRVNSLTYPDEPPEVYCKNNIYHPNINVLGEAGDYGADICVNLLGSDWEPDVGLDGSVMAVLFLFYNPQLDDALSPVCSDNQDWVIFEENVHLSLRGKEIDGFFFDKLIEDLETNVTSDTTTTAETENPVDGLATVTVAEQSNNVTEATTTEVEQSNDAPETTTTEVEQSNDEVEQSNNAPETTTTEVEQSNNATEATTTEVEQSNNATETATTEVEQSNNATETTTTEVEQSNNATEATMTEVEHSNNATETTTTKIEQSNGATQKTTSNDLATFATENENSDSCSSSANVAVTGSKQIDAFQKENSEQNYPKLFKLKMWYFKLRDLFNSLQSLVRRRS